MPQHHVEVVAQPSGRLSAFAIAISRSRPSPFCPGAGGTFTTLTLPCAALTRAAS